MAADAYPVAGVTPGSARRRPRTAEIDTATGRTGICVELTGVTKRYGDVEAVRSMDLSIEDGSFVTLLGPSGCGKTTTLRMIAGLDSITTGDISIKGRCVNDVPIHKRNLGLVFQNYALFPHKTVFDNVAFGLKYRGVGKAERTEKVRQALEIVRLPQVGDRHPAQLSGGQQQRIALARAIVIEPDVLLLDEPLSALDANLREEMRVELKRIQRELGITTIFVTHDQGEALALSDKVVVMSNGVMEQVGSPEDVYNRPRSRFVANFLGNSNLFDVEPLGREHGLVVVAPAEGVRFSVAGDAGATGGGTHTLVIRAEKVRLAERHAAEPGLNVLDGRVTAVDYQGQFARYFVTAGPLEFQAINPIDRRPFREGAPVQVAIAADDCVLLAADGT